MMRGHELRRPASSADIRKPLSVQTDGPDGMDSASDADSEYVTCVPSPHTFSLSSLRRDNLSARGFAALGGATGGDARGCAKKVIILLYCLQFCVHTTILMAFFGLPFDDSAVNYVLSVLCGWFMFWINT